MARLQRLPPGRTRRLWLQHRIAVATRGAELLDQKLRILHTEAHRLASVAEGTAAAWREATREADTWLLRSVLLGGERAVRLASDDGDAVVDIVWAQTMGVRYPREATCSVPLPAESAAPPTSAALLEAQIAFRRAVDAAVQHAVAQAAARVLAAEEAATRRRLRAINQRWIPQLTEALAEAQLVLEEQEHEDGVRLRWAHTVRVESTGAGSPEEAR